MQLLENHSKLETTGGWTRLSGSDGAMLQGHAKMHAGILASLAIAELSVPFSAAKAMQEYEKESMEISFLHLSICCQIKVSVLICIYSYIKKMVEDFLL